MLRLARVGLYCFLLSGFWSLSAMDGDLLDLDSVGTCNIKGLDRVDVVKALFIQACDYEWEERSIPDDAIIKSAIETDSLEKLAGRLLRISFCDDDTFNTCLYNRENGPAAAETAIAQLRERGPWWTSK